MESPSWIMHGEILVLGGEKQQFCSLPRFPSPSQVVQDGDPVTVCDGMR